jgi:hypothetical protein
LQLFEDYGSSNSHNLLYHGELQHTRCSTQHCSIQRCSTLRHVATQRGTLRNAGFVLEDNRHDTLTGFAFDGQPSGFQLPLLRALQLRSSPHACGFILAANAHAV